MSNKNLKEAMKKHFKNCNVKYDKKIFNSFFRSYEQICSTDNLDLTEKRDKTDFDWLLTALCLCFEEHERLIKRRIEGDAKMSKVELEGELFVLVEETKTIEGEEDVSICAELCGINIWDWLYKNNGHKVKIILEKIEEKNENRL